MPSSWGTFQTVTQRTGIGKTKWRLDLKVSEVVAVSEIACRGADSYTEKSHRNLRKSLLSSIDIKLRVEVGGNLRPGDWRQSGGTCIWVGRGWQSGAPHRAVWVSVIPSMAVSEGEEPPRTTRASSRPRQSQAEHPWSNVKCSSEENSQSLMGGHRRGLRCIQLIIPVIKF